MTFLSTHGHYFGRLESTSHVNALRLKKQIYLSDDPNKRLVFAKSTLKAKIHNQAVLLRRYARSSNIDISGKIKSVEYYEKKMRTDMNYLSKLEAPMSFRRGIWWQVKSLAHCIDDEDLSSYKPLRIR